MRECTHARHGQPPGQARRAEGRDLHERRVGAVRDSARTAALGGIGGLCLLAVLLSFSDKAYTIDDPLFLWLGSHLQSHPFDFFGFSVNWDGNLRPMYEVTRNPPLVGYYIAAAGSLFGFGERALHLAFVVPALAAAAGTWRVARRLCGTHRAALEATALACASPVFLISSSNVMCDTTMLAFWMWALALWLDGLDGDKPLRLWGAAVLVAAAGLTKYFGFALIPLLAAYAGWHAREPATPSRGGRSSWVLPLALPVGVAFGYEMLTTSLYGTGLLFDAARFAGDWRAQAGPSIAGRVLLGLAFAGGCSLATLLFAPLLWSPRGLVLGGLASVAAFLAPETLLGWTGLEDLARVRSLALQLALFAFGGVSLLALLVGEARRSFDAEALLLILWVGGTLLFAVGFNWTNNGRSNLAAAPAAAILIVRRLQFLSANPARSRTSGSSHRFGGAALHAGLFSLTLAVGLAVAQADARWAGDVRTAARQAVADFVTVDLPVHFWGRWGWQFYLEQAGAVPVEYGAAPLPPGSLLLEPTNNYTLPRSMGPPAVVLLADFGHAIDDRRRWIHTHSPNQGAGFYDSRGRLLPFVFGSRSDVAPDRYRVWRAQRALRFREREAE
jgi:hypothetical protein